MKLLFTLVFLHFISHLIAQTDTLTNQAIAPVTISATRLGNDQHKTPFAVTVLSKSQLQSVQQQLSVHDVLATVPGVFVQNPDNFAQDLRISIRGFGARAAFGIRGIRIITDGIPESTPDGQADVDNLDVGALQSMEVLKGASSALYGNAAGGVIYLKTEEPTDRPFAELQVVQGSYGFQRYQGKAGFRRGKVGTFVSMGYNRSAGYRANAAMRQLIVNNKWVVDFSSKTVLKLLLNYGNSPQADDAGGLTAEQVAADRRQARPQNVQFRAGENVKQGRVGLVLDHRINDRQLLSLRGFITARDFDNRLPFENGGIVDIDRVYGGGGLQYEWKDQLFRRPYRMQTGLELNRQRDHRRRSNNEGGLRGVVTFDQNEVFSSLGAYSIHALQLAEKWSLTASGRLDRVRLSAEDLFPEDGDQSGAIPLMRFSPSGGLNFQWSAASAMYVNVASNFETPTLNELSANPMNTGGFNPELQPQRAWSGEWGLKAQLFPALRVETALFFIGLRDEFVPYQLPQFAGRTFYRNAGKSQRKGLEASLQWNIRPTMVFSLHYTYSDFRYTEYTSGNQNFKHNRTPGIPAHNALAEWRWSSKKGFTAVAQLRRISSFFVNDANTFKNDAYTVGTLRAGFRHQFRGWALEPFAGISNLSGARYNANVLINAAGNRFYEPAAGAYGYAGVKIHFQKNN